MRYCSFCDGRTQSPLLWSLRHWILSALTSNIPTRVFIFRLCLSPSFCSHVCNLLYVTLQPHLSQPLATHSWNTRQCHTGIFFQCFAVWKTSTCLTRLKLGAASMQALMTSTVWISHLLSGCHPHLRVAMATLIPFLMSFFFTIFYCDYLCGCLSCRLGALWGLGLLLYVFLYSEWLEQRL